MMLNHYHSCSPIFKPIFVEEKNTHANTYKMFTRLYGHLIKANDHLNVFILQRCEKES